MRVSVVTAYYGNEDMTIEFLDNLKDKVTSDDEVIVVNSGSNPIEHGVITTRIDLPENISFSHSMNHGLRVARGDYICLIGNDGFPQQPEWLQTLINALESTNSTIVVPKPTRPDIMSYRHLKIGLRENYPEYSMFPAICYLFKKELLTTVGYFDERFIPGCYEDNDYCHRVQLQGGHIILEQEVVVDHRLSKTMGKFNVNKAMAENHTRFKEKWK